MEHAYRDATSVFLRIAPSSIRRLFLPLARPVSLSLARSLVLFSFFRVNSWSSPHLYRTRACVTGSHAVSPLRLTQMRTLTKSLSLTLPSFLAFSIRRVARACHGVTELNIISRIVSSHARANLKMRAAIVIEVSVYPVPTVVYRRFLRGCGSMTVATNEMRVSETPRIPSLPCPPAVAGSGASPSTLLTVCLDLSHLIFFFAEVLQQRRCLNIMKRFKKRVGVFA